MQAGGVVRREQNEEEVGRLSVDRGEVHSGAFAAERGQRRGVVVERPRDQLVRRAEDRNLPHQRELVATGRTEAEIAREISADLLIYQDLEALKAAVRAAGPGLTEFEASCFDGKYITGDVTADYLSQLAEESRSRVARFRTA